jgi:hypothetical protein
MLSGRPEPRINEEIGFYISRTLQILVIGTCTKIILRSESMGVELAPYKLPKYLPVRIFAMEYIRQMINSDDIHFLSLKKKKQLRIKG